jgi:hypothetical protein
MTPDPRFERRVVAEMARLERAAHPRPRPRRNDPMPQNSADAKQILDLTKEVHANYRSASGSK